MLTRGVGEALLGALALVLPVWCVGCDAPDVVLCDACRVGIAPRVQRRTVDGTAVWSGLAFDGVAARLIRAVKEEGRTPLLREVAPALQASVGAALAAAPVGTVALVPVPTSSAAMRRRGFRVVELACARAGLSTQRLLRSTGRAGDQRELGRAERVRNVSEAFRADRADGRRVLLVDDVVTTGATVAAAARALARAGAEVVGAAAIASTARRGFVTEMEDDTGRDPR